MSSYILAIFSILIISTSFLNADIFDQPMEITSSTAFTQDISTNYNPDIDVITSKDIEQLGVENLADLLSVFAGINIYHINSSTAAIDLRGYAEIVDSAPKILIDGRETEDQFVSRSYLYNLPLTIDDIDRIEVIKGNTFYSDGYSSPAGLINIVTKSPEELDANYVNVTKGSNDLKKINFSVNKFLFNTYFKIIGEIRATDEYNNSKETDKHKFVELSMTKYIGEKSLLYIKAFASNGKGNFNDRFVYNFFNKWIYLPYDIYTTDIMGRNFFISYRYPSLEISFLYNYYKGTAYAKVFGIDTNFASGGAKGNYYKFNFKKDFSLKNNKITIGLDNRYQDYEYFSQKPAVNTLTLYVKDEFTFSKYLTLRGLIKNDRATNYGNNFNYYTSISFHSKDKNYGVELAYSKNIKFPRGLYKYFRYETDLTKIPKTAFSNSIAIKNAIVENNKNLKPIKFYSTELKLFYNRKKFNFKTTFFYNRITDTVSYSSGLYISGTNSSLVFIPENFDGFIIHGFETDLHYNISKYVKLFSSYYLQHIKIKTVDEQKDFIVPKYKFTVGSFFTLPYVSGSVIYSYVPEVKQIDGKSSDDYSELDLNITKKFLKNKFKCSVGVKNLLNNIHRETPYGLKIKRSFFVKIGYNF